jgi:DNA-binding SARP family transcriptional activator
MMPLTLKVLGGFELQSGAGRRLTFPTKKAQALLAYLALHPDRPCSRETLTALLWGDTRDAQARQSLRQAVYHIRQALGDDRPSIVMAGEAVTLRATALEVDALMFEQRVRQATPESLHAALGFYRGDLLEGLAIKEAPFDEWLLVERERLRELALEALARLVSHYMKSGDNERAIQAALRLLALDPLHEPAHRALMRLYARQGRRAAALRQYQTCVGILRRELGAEPEPETQQLYQEIVPQPAVRPGADSLVSLGTVPALTGMSGAAETPLIGRQPEHGHLHSALEQAWQGSGSVRVVIGDAGVGKSRLLDAIASEAIARGGRVLAGACHETEQVLPFSPWIGALRAGDVITGLVTMPELAQAWRVELARLIPELAEPGSEPVTTSENSLRLFEAIVELLQRLAARQPLVVLLEDLQWADDSSLRLFAFVARRITGARVLLLATVRAEDLAATPLLRETLDEIERDQPAARLELGPLGESETRALVHALLPTGRRRRRTGLVARRVWATSEGNPFVIVETIRAMEEGRLATSPGELDVPERVRHMIVGRLDCLTVNARRLAAAAAVIGRPFSFALLRRTAGLNEASTAEGVEELVRRRVFSAASEEFTFTHQRVRDVVYDSVARPLRVELHTAAGEALEVLYADGLDAAFDRLAYHFSHADQPLKAFRYLLDLADRAARSYALEAAVQFLEQALQQLQHFPPESQDRRHLDAVFRLVHVLSFMGRLSEALDLLTKAQPRVARLRDPAMTSLHTFWLGHTYGNLGDGEQAATQARRALEEALRTSDDAMMGRAYFLLSRESFYLTGPLEGVKYGQRAAARLTSAADRWWLGQAHWYTAFNLLHLGEYASALDELIEVGAIGQSLGDGATQSDAAWATGWIMTSRGEYESGVETIERGVSLARSPLGRAKALGFLGIGHLEAGNASAAVSRLEEAMQNLETFTGGRPSRYSQLFPYFTAHLAEAKLLQGDRDGAHVAALKAEKLAGSAEWWLAYAHRALGKVAWAAGDFNEAAARLGRALTTFVAIEARYQVARTHALLAEVHHGRSEKTTAAMHLREARDRFERLSVPRWVERVTTLAGRRGLSID